MSEAELSTAAALIRSYFRTLFWLIVGSAVVIVIAEIAIWIWFGLAVVELRQLIDDNKCRCTAAAAVTTSGNTITIQGQRTREDSILEIAKQIQQGQRNDVSGNQRTDSGTPSRVNNPASVGYRGSGGNDLGSGGSHTGHE